MTVQDSETAAGLREQIRVLTRRVDRLQATEDVRRLQNIYGYYMDRFLYDQVVPLMSGDCEIRFMGGIYRGTAGARRLFIENLGATFADRRNRPPVPGRLAEHEMLSDVITVADDARSARARFRHILKAGWHESILSRRALTEVRAGIEMAQWFEGGIYENQYIMEDGAWKFRLLDYQLVYFGSVEHGWTYTPAEFAPWFRTTYPQDPGGPDELMDPPPLVWPDMVSVPYHYPNPVTGQTVEF